ncbi:MAG: hypothetical protein ACOH1Y_15895 [Propionicimonas sp.]
MKVTIGGVEFDVTKAGVLKGTLYKRPDRGGVTAGSHWVLIRGRRVPARWAIRMTLGVAGRTIQTNQAVSILNRLGFTTGQQTEGDQRLQG